MPFTWIDGAEVIGGLIIIGWALVLMVHGGRVARRKEDIKDISDLPYT